MTLHAMAQRIEHWPLDKLIPYARNPRTHSDAQVAQIAASIAEFGFNNPILVDTKAGIIAGHGRLLAARKLQLKEVPVIVLDHLTEAQKRAYIIADNQLALNAGWDESLLAFELAALQEEDFNSASSASRMKNWRACSPRRMPPRDSPMKTRSRNFRRRRYPMAGDLWILGNHRLLVGDATDQSAVARLMAGDAADLDLHRPAL